MPESPSPGRSGSGVKRSDSNSVFLVRSYRDPNPKASHLASAIAAFGPPVVDDLIALTTDPDPDLRALACRALDSTAADRALPALERLAAHDLARTTLGGLVATAAKQGLRTAHRIRARAAST
ncbi:HEAT repeat domain-containing protein [Streptomyces microflavus]|uniref:HEAT repeat domain-containing protein n=1 Tax=Streptomyces microflavus TaxID=1919 RepID=UPI0037FF21C4